MVCDICGLAITGHGPGCEKCGAGVSDSQVPQKFDPRLVTAKLGEANLARIRGRWDEAEARCIDVMRLDPSSLEAHSLLGDLYRDQGRWQDAAQWYRLALDIEGNSTVDREKLHAVEVELARAAGQTGWLRDQARLTTAFGTQRLLGASPVTWLRILTAASVVFVVGVLGVLIALRGRQHQQPAVAASVKPSPTGAPVPLLPGRLPIMAQPRRALDLTDRGQAPTAAPQPGMTTEETLIRQQLERPGVLSPGTTVTALTSSPVTARVDVVLLRPTDTSAEADAARTGVLRDALAAARTAMSIDQRVARVGVSIRSRTPDGRFVPTFDGATDRQSVATMPDSPAPAVVAGAFRNAWWNPELAPVSSAAAARSGDGSM